MKIGECTTYVAFPPKNTADEINLSKFLKEVDKSSFLGLSIDHSSRNHTTNKDDDYHNHHRLILVLNSRSRGPTTSYGCMDDACLQDSRDQDEKSSSSAVAGKSDDDVTIDLGAMFGKETDIAGNITFLGLGIDPLSNYKILNYDDRDQRRACFQDSDDDHTNKGTIGNSVISSSTDQAGNCSTISGGKKKKSPKRKQKEITAMEEEGKRKRQRRSKDVYSEPCADLSPEFLRIIGTTNPVFVYRKQLVGADVKKDQNRLLITDARRLTGLLTEEERRDMEDAEKPPGIDVIGMDCRNMGISSEYTLHVAKWKTMGTVVNKQWNKMVAANEAEAGDWVDLWGYRRDGGRFCLAVNFSS